MSSKKKSQKWNCTGTLNCGAIWADGNQFYWLGGASLLFHFFFKTHRHFPVWWNWKRKVAHGRQKKFGCLAPRSIKRLDRWLPKNWCLIFPEWQTTTWQKHSYVMDECQSWNQEAFWYQNPISPCNQTTFRSTHLHTWHLLHCLHQKPATPSTF